MDSTEVVGFEKWNAKAWGAPNPLKKGKRGPTGRREAKEIKPLAFYSLILNLFPNPNGFNPVMLQKFRGQ